MPSTPHAITSEAASWSDANRRHLLASLRVVASALREQARTRCVVSAGDKSRQQGHTVCAVEADEGAPPFALDRLCATFGLSPFERDIVLLCAGMELDGEWGALCAAAQGDPRKPYPTFSLALAALPESHWSALTPGAPLRHWRLVEVGTGHGLKQAVLRLDERILHFLAGVEQVDERLAGRVVPLRRDGLADAAVPPSQRAVAERIQDRWSRSTPAARLPIVRLCGEDRSGRRAVAFAACDALGLDLWEAPAPMLPTTPGDVEAFVRLWEREAALGARALLLDADDVDTGDHARTGALAQMIAAMRVPLLVSGGVPSQTCRRDVASFDVARPTKHEQRALWQATLRGAAELNGQLDALVAQFDLPAAHIAAAGAEALDRSGTDTPEPRALTGRLWSACCARTRPGLDGIAQRIEPAAAWDDLVLPEFQKSVLREIAVHVRQRATVYDTWGFAAQGARGLGLSALFAGPSGTGKTMAAEVLARELRLDLYRVDLSAVVSKYIGETEKNLRRVFDAAEEGGAILLFDEADALFGKRSEVKDSHDRYANVEISYLLQRMEAYRGLAVLTTNMPAALDPAFLRRIRFVVAFPFPGASQRAEIWRRAFPPAVPLDGLDPQRLASLDVAGGSIRNIAMGAAFLAAEERAPVGLAHVLWAARTEYTKLDKPLPEAETGGWA